VACCGATPVRELKKPAFTQCPHVRQLPAVRPGCSIYAKRPPSCQLWSCHWLADPSWPEEFRPDRCGAVVDIVTDVVLSEDGKETTALQVWALPGHEEGYRVPPMSNFVMSAVSDGYAIIWRVRDTKDRDNQAAVVLMAGAEKGTITYRPMNFALSPEQEARLERAREHLKKRAGAK
jgi:hypothetical protein